LDFGGSVSTLTYGGSSLSPGLAARERGGLLALDLAQ